MALTEKELQVAMSSRGHLVYTPEDIDPEIRDLIKELIESGYETFGSCAGHPGREDEGYVAFRGKFTEEDKKKLHNIFEAYGLTELEFIGDDSIYFKAIGKGIPPETELWWNTVAELRTMCHRHNLPADGNKGDLIWRLLSNPARKEV